MPPDLSSPCDPDAPWQRLCRVDDLPAPDQGGLYVTLGRRALAVFRVGDGAVRVTDDACPHAGASLAGGFIEEGCVVCRYHAWAFDLNTGRCPDNPSIGVRVYPAEVREGEVWAWVR